MLQSFSMSKVTGAHKANADYRAQEASDKGPIEDRTTTEGASNAARLKDMKNRLSEKLATLKERDPEVLKEYFGNKTAQVMGKEKWYKKSDKKNLKENVERQIFRDLYEEVKIDKKIHITENKELGWFKRRADVKKQKKEAKQEIKNNKKELKELFKKGLSEGSSQGLRKTISDTVDQRSEEIKNVKKKDSRWGRGGGIGFGVLGAGIAAGLCYLTGVGAPIGAAITIITAIITGIGVGKGVHHAMKTNRQIYNSPDVPNPSVTLGKVLNPKDQKTSETSSTSKVDKETLAPQDNFSDKDIADYAHENNCSAIKLGEDKKNPLKGATLFANFGKDGSGKTIIQKVYIKADENGTPYFKYTVDDKSLASNRGITQIVKKEDKRYDKFIKIIQESPVFEPAKGEKSSHLLQKKLNPQFVLGKFKENAAKSNPYTKATDQLKPTISQNPQEINPTTADITAEATIKTNLTTTKNASEINATNAVNDISKTEEHQFACPILKEMSEAVDYCIDLNTVVSVDESIKEGYNKTIKSDEIADKISERKETLKKNQTSATRWKSIIQNYENTKSQDDTAITEAKATLKSLEKQIQEDIAYINVPKEHLKKVATLTRFYGGNFSIEDTPEDPLDPNLALSLAQGQGLLILTPHKEEIGLNLQNCDEAYTKLEIPGKSPEEANKTKDKLFEKLWNEDSKASTDMGREQYVNQKISNIKENNKSLANVNEDQLRNFIDAVLKLKGE